MPGKIDSNITGLRYAEELFGSIGVLPGSPIWYPLEPNSYGEFGPQITTTPRNPITASRQRKKGLVTDLDAAAGFQSDFVQQSLYDLMQGFFFADWRKKANANPTAVTAPSYTVASGGTAFLVNSLIFASGFANAANNGLKLVTASTATTVACAGLAVEASPPAGAKIQIIGQQGVAGDITLTVNTGIATLGSTALNFTTLGLIPGEWIFIGGDAVGDKFATAADNGWARIKTIAANAIVLDRQPNTMVTDNGATKTIRLFLGDVIKNESNPALIKMRSYQLERSLSTAGFEYVKGCVANTLEIKIGVSDKVTVDLGFVGTDAEYRSVGLGAKAGTRPNLPVEEAMNASSDFSRLRLLNESTAATLFTYMTELNLTINNNAQPSKAIATLGAFDVSVGDFAAAGSCTAYFTDVAAMDAVRAVTAMSLDFAMVKSNAGWVFDIPYVALGDGRIQVEKDKEITLPLSLDGAAHPTLDHSLLAVSYAYLPTAAD
jgi:Phage tail tube protein